jgi:branched-chain amino acid transport system ATP-binding protein
MVETIFETIVAVNRTGVAILLVEQNVVESLRRSHRAYVVETGRIVLDGRAADVLRDERTRNSILGGGPAAPVIH